jgi:DNA polymerase-1
VSGDRDLLQLVGPLVSVYMPRGKDGETFTPEAVESRWGVPPSRFAALKALMGDASDCIPGVPGIGPRTAAALLTRFGTLEELYAALATLPARQAELLATHRERVWLNFRLVSIVTTLDLAPDPAAYRWSATEPWTARTLLAAVGLRT